MKTVTAIAASLLMLTGCTIDRRTIVTETTTAITQPKPAPATQPPVSPEEAFVAAIISVHAGPVYVSDYELISAGEAVCDGARAGATAQEMVDLVLDSATTQDTYDLLMEVTVAALMFLCPEYEYILQTMDGV